ncbi:MAG: pseudouridine synthase, partial [Parcubacteria group bacterium CG_4_10_14_0_2_um_filter_41_6]
MSNIRLQKIIADAGTCSRRKAEDLIRDRKVRVNGEMAKIGQSADPEKDEIIVDKKKISQEEK